VHVDADDAIEAAADFGHHFSQTRGDRATVGIAQAEDIGAGFVGGLQGAQGVVGVGDVEILLVPDALTMLVPGRYRGLKAGSLRLPDSPS
jgi:hypothetical protein